jgi:hypothetical protein
MHAKPVLALLLATVAAAPAHACDQGDAFIHFAGFTLESGTTLADVQARLGAARIVETGDASEYEAALCYSLPGVDVFFLSGEMGGGTDLIGVALSLPDPSHACAPWPKNVRAPVAKIGGIALGIDRRAFTAKLGVDAAWEGDHADVNFESRRPMSADEIAALPLAWRQVVEAHPEDAFYDISVTVSGRFDTDRLVEVTAWKITSW